MSGLTCRSPCVYAWGVITIALTAGYARVQQMPLVCAALSGIIPAIVGLGLVTAWQIARPLLAHSRRAGQSSAALSLLLLTGSSLAAWRGHFPVVVILVGTALVYALWNWRHQTRRVE